MGRFDGSAVVSFLDDGRRVQLREDFAFVDDEELRWDVPANAIVDGASIPQILWSIIGGPFEGKYRNASIIHDWYCDLRSRHWRSVHIMFYRAMIASGVSVALSKLLYAGVYMGGPRWSETVVSNISLLAEEYLKDSSRSNRPLHYPMPIDENGFPTRRGPYADDGRTRITRVYHYDLGTADLEELRDAARADRTLGAIEATVDTRTKGLKEITVCETRAAT